MQKQSTKEREKEIFNRYHDQIVFDLKRGFLQFITILIISRGPRYAYEIKAEILKITRGGFDIDKNNLYKKLRFLERDGILKSHMEPSARGAQRKYYILTPLGNRLLRKTFELVFPLMKALRDNLTNGQR